MNEMESSIVAICLIRGADGLGQNPDIQFLGMDEELSSQLGRHVPPTFSFAEKQKGGPEYRQVRAFEPNG